MVHQGQKNIPGNISHGLGMDTVPMLGVQIRACGDAFIRGPQFRHLVWITLQPTTRKFHHVHQAKHFATHLEHHGALIKWEFLCGANLVEAMPPKPVQKPLVIAQDNAFFFCAMADNTMSKAC